MSRTPSEAPSAHRQLLRVLLVEDSRADAELCLRELKTAGLEVSADVVETAEEFAERVRANNYDIVLADYNLPDWTGLEALASLQAQGKDIPFILVTGALGEETAVKCIKNGASDYVLKDRLARLPVAVHHALEEKALREERIRTWEALRSSEARYRTLTDDVLDSSVVGIVILDSTFRVVWVNRALERYFGLRRAEVVGKDKQQLIRERLKHIFEDPDRFAQKVFATYQNNTYIENFECHVLAEGEREERWLEHWSQPIRSGLYAGGRIEYYTDLTERKRAEQSLRELSDRLLRLQDEERRRMARELHDTTAQSLTVLAMNLSLVNESAAGLDPKTRGRLAESLSLAEQSARELRTFSYLLHPPLLDEAGLAAALRWYAEGFAQRSGIRVELEIPPEFGRLPREAELALFRIVQEGLANIHRHSGSPTAKIRMVQSPSEVTLEVKDKGRGIAPELTGKGSSGSTQLGVGIRGMQERMRQLGGRLEISSGGQGTTVRAILPFSRGTP